MKAFKVPFLLLLWDQIGCQYRYSKAFSIPIPNLSLMHNHLFQLIECISEMHEEQFIDIHGYLKITL